MIRCLSIHVGVLIVAALTTGPQVLAQDIQVLPNPRIISEVKETVVVAEKGTSPRIDWPDANAGAIDEARALVGRRLAQLGIPTEGSASTATRIQFAIPSRDAFKKRIEKASQTSLPDSSLDSAYLIGSLRRTAWMFNIEAGAPRGIYNAALTLCQLFSVNEKGDLVMPAIQILDWPEIGLRIPKTSASATSFEPNHRLTQWYSLMKFSHAGLQYHGKNSRNPEPPFMETVKTLCGELNATDTLDTVIYFCPFRGDAGNTYDMTKAEDREAYAKRLRQFMNWGADGVEVDYNDWPGSESVPISDVLNLAEKTVSEIRKNAIVLYCPPVRGDELYHGMASETLGNTLSNVPPSVWPLWTGMGVLIVKPLPAAKVQEWISIAGRKPVLWVNRVGPNAKETFVQKTSDGNAVFAGSRIPSHLAELFEGVHLNNHLPSDWDADTGKYDTDSLIYLATAADYLWNPGSWDANASYLRAKAFVDTMAPLLPKEAPKQ